MQDRTHSAPLGLEIGVAWDCWRWGGVGAGAALMWGRRGLCNWLMRTRKTLYAMHSAYQMDSGRQTFGAGCSATHCPVHTQCKSQRVTRHFPFEIHPPPPPSQLNWSFFQFASSVCLCFCSCFRMSVSKRHCVQKVIMSGTIPGHSVTRVWRVLFIPHLLGLSFCTLGIPRAMAHANASVPLQSTPAPPWGGSGIVVWVWSAGGWGVGTIARGARKTGAQGMFD